MSAASCAVFLIVAFVLAGVAQTAWFASAASRRFDVPLDGGLMLGGERLLGANKTLRGFVVMVPAAAAAFAGLAYLTRGPAAAGLWPLSTPGYAGLGAAAGFGFMAGELPNSFVKRRLGIGPGALARGRWSGVLQFLIDRVDSGVGMLLAVSALSPTPALTWVLVLLIGPSIHWLFSVLMFHMGLKARPA
jgi:CDP-2,3-bis-(O-geranylgeranyl)-sn-glycerol synthase